MVILSYGSYIYKTILKFFLLFCHALPVVNKFS